MQIIDQDYWKVWWQALKDDYDPNTLLDSVSPNQLQSKEWLVDKIPLDEISKFKDLKIHIYGGWYGFPLIDMLLEKFDNIHSVTNIDCDETAIALCRRYAHARNVEGKVDYKLQDVKDPISNNESVRLVINTSSEHMPDLPTLIANKNYTDNCVFALQSNNMFHVVDQHTNCKNSLEEFVESTGLTKIWFADSYLMPNGYERYTVIGNRRT